MSKKWVSKLFRDSLDRPFIKLKNPLINSEEIEVSLSEEEYLNLLKIEKELEMKK